MINSNECAQLLEIIPADQLEEKYMGTLKPPKEYWYRFLSLNPLISKGLQEKHLINLLIVN